GFVESILAMASDVAAPSCALMWMSTCSMRESLVSVRMGLPLVPPSPAERGRQSSAEAGLNLCRCSDGTAEADCGRPTERRARGRVRFAAGEDRADRWTRASHADAPRGLPGEPTEMNNENRSCSSPAGDDHRAADDRRRAGPDRYGHG